MSVPSAASSVSKPTAHKRTCFRSETSSFLGQIQVLQVAELSETISMSFSSRVAACRYTTKLQGKSSTRWAEAKADKAHWSAPETLVSRSLLLYVTPSHWIELLGSQGQAGWAALQQPARHSSGNFGQFGHPDSDAVEPRLPCRPLIVVGFHPIDGFAA